MRYLVLATCLLSLGTNAGAQDTKQLMQQLRSGNEETRMNAFLKLLEGNSISGLAQNRQELVRELNALGDREQARLLDATQRFSPEQMSFRCPLTVSSD
jgi:hypothetical protein